MDNVVNFERSWEEGPVGDPGTAFEVVMDTTGNVAFDPSLPEAQQNEAVLIVAKFARQNRQIASAWLINGQSSNNEQAA